MINKAIEEAKVSVSELNDTIQSAKTSDDCIRGLMRLSSVAQTLAKEVAKAENEQAAVSQE
jgi:hypothetical protein